MKEVICSVEGCSRNAEYHHESGKICRGHYRRWKDGGSFGKPIKQKSEWATCSVEGCDTKSRSIGAKLCEKHYYRKYRTGDLSDLETGRNWFSSHGYVGTYAPLHELAGKSGVLYLHRAVLHDNIGGGVHPCHWCCEEVEWGAKGARKLVADHLDNNKKNNEPDNLVASCNTCNATRGLFMSWVLKHRDDPFLLRLFKVANDDRQPKPRSKSVATPIFDSALAKAA